MAARSSSRRVRRTQLVVLAALCAVVAALALAWRFTPLQQLADPQALAQRLHALARTPWAPLIVVLLYVGGNAVLFPNTVLNMATIVGLGTLPGLPYALLGSLAAAMAGYAVGRRYGEDFVDRIDAAGVERVSKALRKSGTLHIAVLRLLPIAPYTLVNLAAGAARVRPLFFGAGTVLGLLPGTLLVTAFGHQLRAAVRDPSASDIALMVVIVAVALGGGWALRRYAQRYA